MDRSAQREACPASAVSHGVGLVGLAGLGIWIAIARHHGMDGPYAGLAGVIACALPMILWSLIVDKVHRNPSTGLDLRLKRRFAETRRVSLTKLVGLWGTWGAIAFFYLCGSWYWQGHYRDAMHLLMMAAPILLVLSVPYFIWIDRYLVEPRDGAFAVGQWLLGREGGPVDGVAIANHARSWAVKAFFLAFMLSIVPSNFAGMVNWRADDLWSNPVSLAGFLITLMFVVDVAFATAGYILTMRPLDAHIRTANPLLGGWVAALLCYPPFVMMGEGGPLFYEVDTRSWDYWLAGAPMLLWLWGGVLVALTGIYAWSTVAFGLRFSNLTHRGILTHGPYRFSRHPAYLSKNLFWWLSVLPFLTTTDSLPTAVRNTALLAVTSGIYFWRARTEEAHLSQDPAYRAYSDWMTRHGAIPRFFALLIGRKSPALVPEPAK